MHKSSVVYLNYSPYENSGHILDYLLENFEIVYLFSIAFHTLGQKNQQNKFTTYKNGKIFNEEYLFYMNVPERLVFLLIPFRSLMNAVQIFLQLQKIKQERGKVNTFFTVNAYIASIGRIMKRWGFVEKTVFWVWDYYPISHPNIIARIMRWLYWQFDKFATYSDRVIYLHKRLAQVRKDLGIIDKNKKCIIIPIGTGERMPVIKKDLKNIKIGFIGVLKKSQGVDMLIDSAETLAKKFKSITFEIIGSGPDEQLFKSRYKNVKGVKYHFYGLVSEKKFREILYKSTIGISPYVPDSSSMSRYTDPGKPKRYIEFNLPVITTDVIEFSREIEENGAGKVVAYEDYQSLAGAINEIIATYDIYTSNVIKLHMKYYYKNIYQQLFT